MFVVARRLASHGRLARLSTAAAPLYAPLVGEHVHPTAVIEPDARLGKLFSIENKTRSYM
jgi:UDP-3-O-[3-hydroxymyristoyl] glucosamine N-acyltransferase